MKQALITGASSGIGHAAAVTFLDQGLDVVGLARDFSSTPKSQMQPCVVDLADLDALPNTLQNQPELQRDFDVLVLNAGYGQFGGLENFSYAQIQQLINTNLLSNLFLLKHFLPKFKQHGGSDIVIVGSESALQGAKQGSVYCASKFALRGLAQSLRSDCANSDVRVILVNPGPVDSDFFDDLHFQPVEGEDYAIPAEQVATAILQALQQPRSTVIEEVNIQPMKRAFTKK